MASRRRSFFENIVQRFTTIAARDPETEVPDKDDSDVETRKAVTDGSKTLTSFSGAWDWYSDKIECNRTRFAKYKDYEAMDMESPVLSSALDVYADNATQGDADVDNIITIKTEDDKIRDLLYEAVSTLKLDEELWSIARALAKYGDDFEELVAQNDGELHRMKNLKASTMIIQKDDYGRYDKEHPYIQLDDESHEIVAMFKAWQIVHFVMRKDRNSSYGVDGSVFASLRKVYKQLSMMEDGMVIARLTRAVQRFGFLVDVQGIEPGKETTQYLTEVKNSMKKRRMINQQTGRLDTEYNPLSMEEDLFIGVRPNSKADVKVLQGASNIGVITDVEYFQNKLFAGLKVPKAYLGFEADVNAKATLTEQDVQFARSVRRIQVALVAGLRDIFNMWLLVRGVIPSSVEFEILLPAISTVDELRRWEVEKVKLEIAKYMKADLNISLRWILVNLLEMSEEDIADIIADLQDPESLEAIAGNVQLERALALEMALRPSVPEPTGEPVATQAQAEAKVSPRQLRIMKFRLREDLSTLKELLDWETESILGKPFKKEA